MVIEMSKQKHHRLEAIQNIVSIITLNLIGNVEWARWYKNTDTRKLLKMEITVQNQAKNLYSSLKELCNLNQPWETFYLYTLPIWRLFQPLSARAGARERLGFLRPFFHCPANLIFEVLPCWSCFRAGLWRLASLPIETANFKKAAEGTLELLQLSDCAGHSNIGPSRV